MTVIEEYFSDIVGGDVLTYLCEARPIESIKAPRGNLCVFPFTHNNVTYDSCAQPDNTNQDICELRGICNRIVFQDKLLRYGQACKLQ